MSIARRRFTMLLGGAAVVAPLAARAQSSAPSSGLAPIQSSGWVPRVGFLYPGLSLRMEQRIVAVRGGIRSIGYEGAASVEFLARQADDDPAKLPALAADLVRRELDLLITVSQQALRAVRAISSTIPVVAHDLESDPVASGIVANLARPGGNTTGMFADFPDIGMQWLRLLKEAVPKLSSVVALRDPDVSVVQFDAVAVAGRLLNVKVQAVDVLGLADVEPAFRRAAALRPDAVIILTSPNFGTDPRRVAYLARAARLPTVTLAPAIVRAGGLIAYGPNLLDTFRLLGTLVGKVLQGTLPADLAIERPAKFDLVINLKTAKTLGLTLPPELLARADDLIEK